jgi:hypothetical protein
VLLLAQCAPGAPCELPTGLPWYFGLAVALVWLATVVGVVLLARRVLLRRLRDRRDRRGRHDGDEQLALEATTSGGDLEPW